MDQDQDEVPFDFWWTVFCTAARSFRRNSLLRPFPPMFYVDQHSQNGTSAEPEKDFDKLVNAEQAIRGLEMLGVGPSIVQRRRCSSSDLHRWLMNNSKVQLTTVAPTCSEESLLARILKENVGLGGTAGWPKPSHVFRVSYKDEQSEVRFSAGVKVHGSLFAFHGSALSNFYSIIHNGLASKMNKKRREEKKVEAVQTSAFGKGSYLSTELPVSLNWGPTSLVPASSWSVFGGCRLGCVALCQVIRHPTDVLIKSETSKANGIPDAYILVKNDVLVRVRYVIVYSEGASKPPSRLPLRIDYSEGLQNAARIVSRTCINWMVFHRFWMLMLTYLVVISFVGLASNGSLTYYWNMLNQHWNIVEDQFLNHVGPSQHFGDV